MEKKNPTCLVDRSILIVQEKTLTLLHNALPKTHLNNCLKI